MLYRKNKVCLSFLVQLVTALKQALPLDANDNTVTVAFAKVGESVSGVNWEVRIRRRQHTVMSPVLSPGDNMRAS